MRRIFLLALAILYPPGAASLPADSSRDISAPAVAMGGRLSPLFASAPLGSEPLLAGSAATTHSITQRFHRNGTNGTTGSTDLGARLGGGCVSVPGTGGTPSGTCSTPCEPTQWFPCGPCPTTDAAAFCAGCGKECADVGMSTCHQDCGLFSMTCTYVATCCEMGKYCGSPGQCCDEDQVCLGPDKGCCKETAVCGEEEKECCKEGYICDRDAGECVHPCPKELRSDGALRGPQADEYTLRDGGANARQSMSRLCGAGLSAPCFAPSPCFAATFRVPYYSTPASNPLEFQGPAPLTPGLGSSMWHLHDPGDWSTELGSFETTGTARGWWMSGKRERPWFPKSGTSWWSEPRALSCDTVRDLTLGNYPEGCGNKAALGNGVIVRWNDAQTGDGHIHARFKVQWQSSKTIEGVEAEWTPTVKLVGPNDDDAGPLYFVTGGFGAQRSPVETRKLWHQEYKALVQAVNMGRTGSADFKAKLETAIQDGLWHTYCSASQHPPGTDQCKTDLACQEDKKCEYI